MTINSKVQEVYLLLVMIIALSYFTLQITEGHTK